MATAPARRGGQVVPLSLLAKVDENVLYCDDNLYRLASFPAESVDLIYLDPPFFSNRNYEVLWGDEAEVRSFEDRWEGGMNVYVNWMGERVLELHRVLKPTGSFYLHCDPHASHYLKVMLDGVFGETNFRNEVVWKRTNVHSDSKRWSDVSDRLLYYVKDNASAFAWNPLYSDLSAEHVESKYRMTDPDGRHFTLSDMTSPSSRPNMMYEWKGHASPKMGWRYSVETMTRLDDEARIWYPNSKDKRPRLKRYLDEMPGNLATDVWTDINPINSQARERMGYPTQKPEALLERIINASSNQQDIVLDPFAGCGTTLVAAQRLRRRWVGIDISPTAVNLMSRRMQKVGANDIRLVGMPTTVGALRTLKPFEFQNWVIQRFNGTYASRQVHDYGVDGLSFFHHWPIQVKQSDHVGRNVVDNFETAMERVGKEQGYIVGFSFTRGSHEEAARAQTAKRQSIRLVTVAELLEAVPDLAARGADLFPEDLPLPSARPFDTRPSVDQLISSDRKAS
jgi:DNA modification methylase